MENRTKLKKSEVGQTLVYVTIIVALAALIIAPMLRFTYTGHRSVRIREERMLEIYAADAGIEDAMYQIQNEDDIAELSGLNFGETYDPGTPDGWNDRDMDVSIEKVWIPGELPGGLRVEWDEDNDRSDVLKMVGLYTFVERVAAEDGFENSGWDGGTGWDADWDASGSASKGTDVPYDGDRYLRFAFSGGSAERATSLSGFYQPRLQFYANAGSFEDGDSAACMVSTEESPGAGDWDTLVTWGNGDETGVYQFVDLDLSSYGNSSDFWVSFDAGLSGVVIAEDDFESGSWSGGTGWFGDWLDSGDASITTYGSPHSGSRHLRLRDYSGYAARAVDLSGYTEPRLQFWAQASSFESGDKAYCRVSADGTNWTTVRTWDNSQGYHFVDIDLSSYVEGSSQFWIAFDADMSSDYDQFYVDDVEIVDDDYFYVDELWIGDDVDAYTIEIAYTTDTLGHAWLDTLGAWLPPGWQYEDVIEVDGLPDRGPDVIESSFAGGTVLQWDFSGDGIDLQQPLGPRPVVRSLTFTFTGGQENEGIFTWIKATSESGGLGSEFLSWDTGYEIYRAVSSASHEIWGSNTEVVAYTAQGEIDKRGLIAYGNYQATGSPLLIDTTLDSGQIKETRVDPADPDTWTTVDYGGGDEVTYTGRATINEGTGNGIPEDAEVVAAWLYWSAFLDGGEYSGGDWWDPPPEQGHASGDPDTAVEFMYPRVYGPETFEVLDGDEVYTVDAYTDDGEPIVLEPRDVLAYLTPKRYVNEFLGTAYDDNGNETFTTEDMPVLASPEPDVFLGITPIFEGDDYTINYDTGEVTIINESLAGNVYIDYSVSELGELNKGSDYSVDYDNGKITMTNEYLVGNVTVFYWAQHWDTAIIHNAVDRYGTELDPAVKYYSSWGWFYGCFADVTSEVTGAQGWTPIIEDYAVPIGNGEYAVREIDATTVYDHINPPGQAGYSGWSLIVLYESPTETAHQFYLYDPVHHPYDPGTHPDGCPFFSGQNRDINFTLTGFYPPEGSVEGRMTYFVGEGDQALGGDWPSDADYLQFKGASQSSFPSPSSSTTLHDEYTWQPNGEWDNVINARSTNGERGVDIDTFDILDDVGDDTEANIRFHTGDDGWSLVYVILSFKTEMVPKQDYFFNVAAVTYSYELGTVE